LLACLLAAVADVIKSTEQQARLSESSQMFPSTFYVVSCWLETIEGEKFIQRRQAGGQAGKRGGL